MKGLNAAHASPTARLNASQYSRVGKIAADESAQQPVAFRQLSGIQVTLAEADCPFEIR